MMCQSVESAPNLEFFSYQAQNYHLSLTYTPKTTKTNEELVITVRDKLQMAGSQLHGIFDQKTLTQSVKGFYVSLDMLFQCLKNPEYYELDTSEKKIKPQIVTIIGQKKFIKTIDLQLQEIELTEKEIFSEKLFHYQKELRKVAEQKENQISELNRYYENKMIQERQQQENYRIKMEWKYSLLERELSHTKNKSVQKKEKERSKKVPFISTPVSRSFLEDSKMMGEQARGFQKRLTEEKLPLLQSKSIQKNSNEQKKNQSSSLPPLNIISKPDSILQERDNRPRKLATFSQITKYFKKKYDQMSENNEKQSNQMSDQQIQKHKRQEKRLKRSIHIKNRNKRLVRIPKCQLIPIDKKFKYLHLFKIDGSLIKYKGSEGIDSHLRINQIIPANLPFVFTIKVVRSINNRIWVGVCSASEQKSKRWLQNSGILYWGKTGTIWNTNNKGKGFQEEDIVDIYVDIKDCIIAWRVNGHIEAATIPQLFSKKGKSFLPCMEFENVNDCVCWIGCRVLREKWNIPAEAIVEKVKTGGLPKIDGFVELDKIQDQYQMALSEPDYEIIVEDQQYIP